MDKKAENMRAKVGRKVDAASDTQVAAAKKVMPSTTTIMLVVQKLTRPIVDGVNVSFI
jgi:hypothetical protein